MGERFPYRGAWRGGRGSGGRAAMTRSCSALGCTARDNGRSRERGISFHQFPVDAAQRREWIRAVNRVDPRSRQAWRPGPGAILCSRHFAEADFERYGLRRKLRRGAVPSRFPRPEPPAAGRRVPAGALKPPLRSPAAGVAAGDHNYSLEGRLEAGAEPEPPLQTPRGQEGPEVGSCPPTPAHRPGAAGNVLRELAEKRRLPEETASLLQAQFSDLPWDTDSWRQMAEYSPEMKQFACVLHLYDIKAYDYLRKIFPLPHPYSLTNWLSNKEAAAGFSNDIFLHLQEKVERVEQAYFCCALLVQEVSLCKQQEWDPQTQRLTGFVDVGAGVLDADEAPLASEAVVLMAVGISSPWTAPLGYFLVNSVTGCLLAQLLRQTISKLNNVGIRVLAVTSGTTARGAETARALGIRIDPERMQCTFQHPPGSPHSIAFFFDVCQALQLVRNALQCFQRIQGLGDTVQWQHVVELAVLPERRVSEPRSPMSGRPGSEESYHLKVNLAALLFSEGVAAALEHLQELGLAAFQSCSGTVGFVRLMSHLSDVFHSRGPYRRGLEGPLLAGNYTKISHLFNEAKNLFVTLTDATGSCVTKSKRRLGFLSLLLNAESLKWLYTSYVCAEGSPSHRLPTHASSLDPLQLFLRTLQQTWGGGETPTCAAFQAAYHKLLAGCRLEPCPPHRGPLGSTSSFDVSLSRRRALSLGCIRAQYNPACGSTVRMEHPSYAGLLQGSALSDALTDLSLCRQSVTRAAGLIVEQLASGLQCEACLASLFEADERRPRCGALLYVKKFSGVSLPSASVCRVTSVTERVLNLHGKGGGGMATTKLRHLALELRVFQELLGDSSLFPSLTEHLSEGQLCLDNHYTILVREITRRYLNTRINQARHLNPRYCCGRDKSKQPGGTCLFPSALGSCQPSQSHLGS